MLSTNRLRPQIFIQQNEGEIVAHGFQPKSCAYAIQKFLTKDYQHIDTLLHGENSNYICINAMLLYQPITYKQHQPDYPILKTELSNKISQFLKSYRGASLASESEINTTLQDARFKFEAYQAAVKKIEAMRELCPRKMIPVLSYGDRIEFHLMDLRGNIIFIGHEALTINTFKEVLAALQQTEKEAQHFARKTFPDFPFKTSEFGAITCFPHDTLADNEQCEALINKLFFQLSFTLKKDEIEDPKQMIQENFIRNYQDYLSFLYFESVDG